jgi:hypothetical protein
VSAWIQEATSVSSGDGDSLGMVAGVGGCIGAVFGIVQGFNAHGIGGAIVGGFVGFLGGMVLGALAVFALGIGIVALVIYAVYWVLSNLWNVGRP